MARACAGLTRAGRPCSLTAASNLTDERGRAVTEPLRRGGAYCLFHAQPFCRRPVLNTGPLVVLFLDLETTGVDVARDRIVELAATPDMGGITSPIPLHGTAARRSPRKLLQERRT